MSVACRFVCDAAKETELYSFSLKPKRNDPSLSDEFVALILSHPKISPLPRWVACGDSP